MLAPSWLRAGGLTPGRGSPRGTLLFVLLLVAAVLGCFLEASSNSKYRANEAGLGGLGAAVLRASRSSDKAPTCRKFRLSRVVVDDGAGLLGGAGASMLRPHDVATEHSSAGPPALHSEGRPAATCPARSASQSMLGPAVDSIFTVEIAFYCCDFAATKTRVCLLALVQQGDGAGATA